MIQRMLAIWSLVPLPFLCKITTLPESNLKRRTLTWGSQALSGSLVVSLLDYNAAFLVQFWPTRKKRRHKERKSQYSDVCAQREMELPHPDKQAAKWRQLQGLLQLRDMFSPDRAKAKPSARRGSASWGHAFCPSPCSAVPFLRLRKESLCFLRSDSQWQND